jgi:hypothetical protein
MKGTSFAISTMLLVILRLDLSLGQVIWSEPTWVRMGKV